MEIKISREIAISTEMMPLTARRRQSQYDKKSTLQQVAWSRWKTRRPTEVAAGGDGSAM